MSACELLWNYTWWTKK